MLKFYGEDPVVCSGCGKQVHVDEYKIIKSRYYCSECLAKNNQVQFCFVNRSANESAAAS